MWKLERLCVWVSKRERGSYSGKYSNKVFLFTFISSETVVKCVMDLVVMLASLIVNVCVCVSRCRWDDLWWCGEGWGGRQQLGGERMELQRVRELRWGERWRERARGERPPPERLHPPTHTQHHNSCMHTHTLTQTGTHILTLHCLHTQTKTYGNNMGHKQIVPLRILTCNSF